MKKSRFTEEQIIRVLKEVEAGQPTNDTCRKYGISDQTCCNWKAKYGGMTVSEAKRFRVLEDENRKLEQIAADLTLDKMALKEIASKNF